MSFGGKPNAWNRQPPPSNTQLNPNIFAGQIGLGQPFAAAQAMQLTPGINALVNPNAFTASMNNAALVAQAQRAQQLMPQAVPRAQSPPQAARPNQRTFVGQVTKLCDTYGFIDEDVFFQTSVIRGAMPRIHDRVMVEATFNPSMPFKWNAYRVQAIQEVGGGAMPQQIQQSAPPLIQRQQQPPPMQMPPHMQSAGGPPNRWSGPNDRSMRDEPLRDPRGVAALDRHRANARRASPPPRREVDRRSPPLRRVSPRRSSSPPRKRDMPPRMREPLPKRERERSPIREREARDPRRSPAPVKRDADSPPRRRQRIIPRYTCYVPRAIASDLSFIELHKRYSSMYIPSDFVRCEMSWKTSFNLEDAITFAPAGVEFHVLHKDVDYPFGEGEEPLPLETADDADSRYFVKVLLLSHGGATALRQKVTGLMADGAIDESCDVQSLFKLLQFVVGSRGGSNRGEFMGIGGAYSPSIDGENPLDPQTLINTAVRTTRAMTGLDLSKCPTWYKMVHLRYYRSERDRKDHVILFLPDISNTPGLMPTADAYRALVEDTFPAQLQHKLAAIDAETFAPQSDAAKKVHALNEAKAAADEAAKAAADEAAAAAAEAEAAAAAADEEAKAAAANATAENAAPTDTAAATEGDTTANTDAAATTGDVAAAADAADTTTDIATAEETSGGDAAAVEEPVKEEPSAAAEEPSAEPMDATSAKQPDDTNKIDEAAVAADAAETKIYDEELNKFETSKKERKAALERHYTISKEPAVLIYPSKTAKGGKFDCRNVSAQSLLDYRLDDNKESAFETFLFAEAFREALDRDFAFGAYHFLHSVLEKDEERKRRDEELSKPDTETADEAMDTDAAAAAPAAAAENGVEHAKAEETSVETVEDGDAKMEVDKQQASDGSKTTTAADDTKADEAAEQKDTEKATDAKEAENKESKDKQSAGGEKADAKDAAKPAPVDPRINFKAVVSDVNAFMTFGHFDSNVCGYLTDRDLEEIIYSIGLNVSRSQVQRLTKKVSSRDRFNYRNYTDRWVDKDGNVKYMPTPVDGAPSRASILQTEDAPTAASSAVASNGGSGGGGTPDVTATGVVYFKGSVLNLAQALEAHKVVDQERSEALLKGEQLDLQLKTTREQRDHLEKKRKRLDEEIDRLKTKTRDLEKSLKTSQDEGAQMKTALAEVKKYGERLVGIVEKTTGAPAEAAEQT